MPPDGDPQEMSGPKTKKRRVAKQHIQRIEAAERTRAEKEWKALNVPEWRNNDVLKTFRLQDHAFRVASDR